MKRINDQDISDIREKANIVDVISNYIPLEQAGSNFKAVCPFHDDHNPSLSINVNKQIYKCFVCGQGGNVFGFVRDYEQISFIEAVKKVGDMVGFDFSDYSIEVNKPRIDETTSRYYHIMDEAQRYLEYTLKNSKDEQIDNFLKQRQLNQDIVETFKLGYADPMFPLAGYLIKKGFKLPELESINLAIINDHGFSEVFNHRLLFPITNENNQIVAYTARSLGDYGPKYINSATSPIFQKSNVLYNYPMTQEPLLKNKPLIMVEGVMDVIAFYKANLRKTIAVLGTALSEEQISLIKKLKSPVVLAFDGDDAGQTAMLTMGQALRKNFIDVSIMNNPSKLDPDEILKQTSKENLIEMVEKPMHWMEFVIKFASHRYGLTSYNARKQVMELSVEQLRYEDEVDQNYFLTQIADVTQFGTEMISDLLRQKKIELKPARVIIKQTSSPQSTSHILKAEKDVLAHILEGKNFAQEFKVKLGYLIDSQANDLALLMTNLYNSHDTISVADCLDLNLSPIQQNLLLEISEDGIFQYIKSSHQLNEAMNLVELQDIENLLKQNAQAILETSDPVEKLRLIQDKIHLQQQKDKLILGG